MVSFSPSQKGPKAVAVVKIESVVDTVPRMLRLSICMVPVALDAPKPYTLNLSDEVEGTVTAVVQVAVAVLPQPPVPGTSLLPLSVHVVPPSVLYASLTSAGPVPDLRVPTLKPVTFITKPAFAVTSASTAGSVVAKVVAVLNVVLLNPVAQTDAGLVAPL